MKQWMVPQMTMESWTSSQGHKAHMSSLSGGKCCTPHWIGQKACENMTFAQLRMPEVTRNQGFMAHLIYLKTIYLSALLKLASNVRIGLKCTESASNVQRENSVHLRPILYTFEADSLYIWGRFSIHLRQILYTHRSCSLIGSEASHEKINYLCLKCADWPQMYRESASNV